MKRLMLLLLFAGFGFAGPIYIDPSSTDITLSDETGYEFKLDAAIWASEYDVDLVNVSATLSLPVNLSCPTASQELGDIESYAYKTVSWSISGVDPGDYIASIDVVEAGGNSAAKGLNIHVEQTAMLPDIVIELQGPAEVRVGDTFLLNATINSTGNVSAEKLNVSLTIPSASSASESGELIDELPVNETTNMTFEITADEACSACTYRLKVIGEEMNIKQEEIEVSTVVPPPPAYHNLAVTKVGPASGFVNESLLLTGTVSNDGNVGENVVARLLIDGTEIENMSLALDAKEWVNPAFNHTFTEAGVYLLNLTVDAVEGEGNLQDNSKVIAFLASVKPVHDITVRSLSAPTTVNPGTEVLITALVENNGNVPEIFVLSMTLGAVGLGNETVSLNASQTGVFDFVWTAGDIGMYNFIVSAHVSGDANEPDNSKSISIHVEATTTPPSGGGGGGAVIYVLPATAAYFNISLLPEVGIQEGKEKQVKFTLSTDGQVALNVSLSGLPPGWVDRESWIVELVGTRFEEFVLKVPEGTAPGERELTISVSAGRDVVEERMKIVVIPRDTKEDAPSGINITKVSSQDLVEGGEGEIRVDVVNTGDKESADVIKIDLPEGWTGDREIQVSLGPGEEKTLVFRVIPKGEGNVTVYGAGSQVHSIRPLSGAGEGEAETRRGVLDASTGRAILVGLEPHSGNIYILLWLAVLGFTCNKLYRKYSGPAFAFPNGSK